MYLVVMVNLLCYILGYIRTTYIFVQYQFFYPDSDASMLTVGLQDSCLSKVTLRLTFLLINKTNLLCYFKPSNHAL